jgi:hypothetical protein|tara:strand:+ start:447 stop:1691 length:1245 start_codon:yes stop_codon:yes gene_type:complete
MALQLYSGAVMGCRKIATSLQIFLSYFRLSSPHHTTVRQWIHRNGCHQVQKPVEKSVDWIVIADETVDVGAVKCLAVIGIRFGSLQYREDWVLSHGDVTLLGLYPNEKITGEYVSVIFSEIKEKVGEIDTFVIDEGSDLKKGARLYKESHPKVKVIHDIKHKMALVMKRHLEADSHWSSYASALAQTRKLLYQTDLAALKPPTQRAKARYMDIEDLIEWPLRILEAKRYGYLDVIPQERYQKYFDWIENYTPSLKRWSLMVGVVKVICHKVRTHGLSEGMYEHLLNYFLETSLDSSIDRFIGECLEKVVEEADKLKPGETMICSTEVLESIFGKHKQINVGKQGITGNILGLGSFVGNKQNEDSVKEAMENCPVKSACHWIKQKVGETTNMIRRKLLPTKGTKFDKNLESASVA